MKTCLLVFTTLALFIFLHSPSSIASAEDDQSRVRQLLDAVHKNDMDEALELLNSKADVNTLLPCSAVDLKPFANSMLALISRSNKQNIETSEEEAKSTGVASPLMLAAAHGNVDMLQLLLKADPKPDPSNRSLAFLCAVYYGHEASTTFLLGHLLPRMHNSPFSIMGNLFWLAGCTDKAFQQFYIIYAASCGRPHIVKAVLSHYQTLEFLRRPSRLPGVFLLSPFQEAARRGNDEAVEVLLEHERKILASLSCENIVAQYTADIIPLGPELITLVAEYIGPEERSEPTAPTWGELAYGALVQMWSKKQPDSAEMPPIPSMTDTNVAGKTALMLAQEELRNEEDPAMQERFQRCIRLLEAQPGRVFNAFTRRSVAHDLEEGYERIDLSSVAEVLGDDDYELIDPDKETPKHGV